MRKAIFVVLLAAVVFSGCAKTFEANRCALSLQAADALQATQPELANSLRAHTLVAADKQQITDKAQAQAAKEIAALVAEAQEPLEKAEKLNSFLGPATPVIISTAGELVRIALGILIGTGL